MNSYLATMTNTCHIPLSSQDFGC